MKEIVDISNETFSLGFKGENYIDIKDLIASLDGAVELLDYVAKSLEKDSFIRIDVKGSRKGSFIIDLGIVTKEVMNLFTKENITFAKLCIDTACAFLGLKKHLKGEKPKSVNKDAKGNTIVENVNSENFTINNYAYNIYGPEADRAVKRMFSSCNRDGVYIEASGEKKIEISKDEFEFMEKEISIDIVEETTTTNTTSLTVVRIKKADFLGQSQWEVSYNSKILKVTLRDEEFKNKLHQGKISITAKTTMKINLNTELYLNEIGEVTKTLYYIDKVIDIDDNKLEQFELNID